MKVEFSGEIFENGSNIKPHENAPSGSRVVPCGRTDATKLTVAFHILRTRLKNEARVLLRRPVTEFSIYCLVN
jgi:hypothetical protein